MISTATGMIVTRSVSDGSLNTDVINQFARQPRAILTAGVVLVILGLIPGTPTLQYPPGGDPVGRLDSLDAVDLAAGAGGLQGQVVVHQDFAPGHLLTLDLHHILVGGQTAEAMAQPEEPPEADIAATPSETDYYKDINNVYGLLTVDPIEMEFGYSLIPLVDESSGGKLGGCAGCAPGWRRSGSWGWPPPPARGRSFSGSPPAGPPPRRFCEHGQLRVVTLDAEVEKRVINSLSKNEQGIYLAMGPDRGSMTV